VTTYNYVTYHLLDAPYRLSQSAVGLIFIVYLVGIFASAWIGARADRVGRERMLLLMAGLMLCGVGLTLLRPLALVGIATITFGFRRALGGEQLGRLHAHHAAQAALCTCSSLYRLECAGAVGGFLGRGAGRGRGVRWAMVILAYCCQAMERLRRARQ
jgi:YNFM family putative membrane transporter